MRAAERLTEDGVETVASPEVIEIVDEQLSEEVTPEQRRELYKSTQAYVDEVGGLSEQGITQEALPSKVLELAEESGIPTVVSEAVEELRADAANPKVFVESLDDATAEMSPHQVDALLEKLSPELDEASQKVLGTHDGEAFVRHVATVSERAGQQGVQVLADALAIGLAQPTVHGEFNAPVVEYLRDLLAEGKATALNETLISTLKRTGQTVVAQVFETVVVDTVKKLQETYEQASADYQEANERLHAELAVLGPTLTPEQIQEYERQFWELPRNKAIREAEEAGGDALSEALTEHQATLERAAIDGNDGAARTLLKSYELLARSLEHADESIAYFGNVNQGSEDLFKALSAVAPDGDLEKHLEETILPEAVPNAQAELLAQGWSGDALLEEQAQLFKNLRQSGKFQKIPGAINDFLVAAEKIRAGDYDPVSDALKSWDNKSKFEKALTVATVVAGIYGADEKFEDGKLPEALQSLLTATDGGIRLAIGLLGTYSKAVGIAAESAVDMAQMSGKLLPGIGLAIDLLELAKDVKAFDDGASPGDIVKVIGTAVSLVGDLAGFIPWVGTAVDTLLGVIGTGIQTLGNMLNGEETQLDIAREEQLELLMKLGFSEDEALLISEGANNGLTLEYAQFDLTPEQMLEALYVSGREVDGTYLAYEDYAWLSHVAAVFGLEGDAFVDLLEGSDMGMRDYQSILLPAQYDHADEVRSSGDYTAYRQAIIDELKASGALSPELIAELEAQAARDPEVDPEVIEAFF